MELSERFETQRSRLYAIAVRLLGGSADAEDAVQETWLRLTRSEVSTIENLDAWLTTVVSRVCLDLLRSPRRTREHSWHVESWTDEPVDPAPDPVDAVIESDRISVALLMVVETLSPAERIAFVLHDVFGQSFDTVADVVDRSPEAARQLASRARRRLRQNGESAGRDRRRGMSLVYAWRHAVETGDLRTLLEMLDENAVLRADYGERIQVVAGASDIAAQAVQMSRLAAQSIPVLVDGMPGLAAVHRSRVVSVMAFVITGGTIASLEVLADPARLPSLPWFEGMSS
ncbi:RNA polymerase sigma-70 factor (ECF subfamily) [Brevibacterium sanguinis]|uniref:RNA polymerase sigma-70 factor (ECF subfamily) n=2 Tax=Brevibacterium TaxID=1696 RepID=A0A366IQ87_9MICO|nr:MULTISPECIES: sigma-70 family RNA polymerase sigma factor [Brevibacterium]RBP67258.1 RNA polymerase sigma-70 factor (ECF subfamily) [Brevibacterium sanguinis]RBP73783.1 RNA polymerase sigma-70 factor (ECF subfamily) [Brevibacterium celere]